MAAAKLAAEESRRYAESIVETVRESLLVLNGELIVITANRSFYRNFRTTPAETIGSFIYDLGNKQWNIPLLRELLEEILPDKEAFDDFEVTHDFEDIGHKVMLLNARQVHRKKIDARMILLAIEDITERKCLETLLSDSEERFRRLFETANDGIVLLEKGEGKITQSNPAAEKMLGYTQEESIGNKLSDIGVLLDLGDFQTTMQHLNERGMIKYDDVPAKTKSGRHIDADIYLVDRAKLVQCNIRDITERKQAVEALRQSEERFKRIFDEGPLGMVILNPGHAIVTANKAFCRFLGYDERELAGRGIEEITAKEDLAKSRNASEQLFAGDLPVSRLQKRYVGKDGEMVWVNLTISPIHGNDGRVLYTLAIIQDLTESRKSADQIHRLHYYDRLTGLPNRTFHRELMKRSIDHARRHKRRFPLIYIGLDNFQRINDSLGYSTGDLLLKAVADRLANAMRKSDYVARSAESDIENVISRAGGDEFIVLAQDLNQTHDTAKTSRRLLAELSAPYDLGGHEIFLTVSIGIALYPDDATEVDDLLKNAEKAMRYSKSSGKNDFHFYSSSMHSAVQEKLTLENDLHRALARHELMLYYQPKVDAATRRVTGMEALIRWRHPDKGLIPPTQFIPMAETSGLILPIGEFVIHTACRQIKTWQEAGFNETNIALNVSGRQFDQQNLIEIIEAALRDAMVSPQCLEVEITETALMRNPEKSIEILTALNALGLRIAIDDFGTGYSSLSYLKRLPLDFLKIDQSFVKGLADDPRDQTIVRTIIVMAHSLSLQTIAEGVETEVQLAFLREHGCDQTQGYLFSRPLPAEEIPGILAKGSL